MVGTDLDYATVALATQRHSNESISFVCADVERWSFHKGRADAVVALEMIEHLGDPDLFIASVAQTLTADGTFIVSTPIAGTGGAPEINPHHQHEFTRESFEKLLSARFSRVKMQGQRRLRSSAQSAARKADVIGLRKVSLLRPLARWLSIRLGTPATEDARMEDFVIDDLGATEGTELVALCSGPIQDHG